jgi:hypothetical protein
MAVQLIGYDLNAPGRDYQALYDAIKQLGPVRWHCLDSTWMVVTNLSSTQIRDALAPHIDSNDTLLVVKLDGSWGTQNMSEECNNWLHDNL